MKTRFSPLLYSCLFTFTGVFSFPRLALAQLRLGTGVQPGLEGYFLEYQQRGLPLNKLNGASGCSVGFGASCNKTGAVLQKIVKEHSGLDYQDLLIKAAGGEQNYQRFIQLYSNPSAVSLMPYSSFWRNGSEHILDSYQNTGIGTLNNTESFGLNEIASNFKYAPVTLGNNNVTIRQGVVGLKTSYGLTLLEEALKVPNINQKIAEVSLNESEASFHQQQFQAAASALNSNSSTKLNNALFYVLSNPYTKVAAPLNRPNLNIGEEITEIDGIALNGGSVEGVLAITEDGDESFLPNSFDEVMEGSSMPVAAIAGVGGVALVLLLLAGGGSGGSDGGSTALPIGDIVALSGDNVATPNQFLPEDNVIPAENNPNPTITVENQNNNIGGLNALEIPESSDMNIFFFLSFIFFLFNRKKVML